jgi:hypothetical protein
LSAPVVYEYALLRAVPRVERGEFVNVAVVLYCQARDFLDCAATGDLARVRAIAPDVDLDGVSAALEGVCSICTGAASAGAAGAAAPRVRFGWLTAPRSTVVQAGPVHSGMTTDPAAELRRLAARLVH